MPKIVLLSLILSAVLSAQTVNEFKKQQLLYFTKEQHKFASYKNTQEQEFKNYQLAQKKCLIDIKKIYLAFGRSLNSLQKKSG